MEIIHVVFFVLFLRPRPNAPLLNVAKMIRNHAYRIRRAVEQGVELVGNATLGASAWELQLGNVSLGALARDFKLWNLGLGTST